MTDNIITLKENQIFVFGSNESGKHGAGAAKQALKFGAKYGQGFGLQGNSFAIPTKDWNIKTLNLSIISFYINRFIVFSKVNPQLEFLVTKIGCGLAGYSIDDIAPLFKESVNLKNVYLPDEFNKKLVIFTK